MKKYKLYNPKTGKIEIYTEEEISSGIEGMSVEEHTRKFGKPVSKLSPELIKKLNLPTAEELEKLFSEADKEDGKDVNI